MGNFFNSFLKIGAVAAVLGLFAYIFSNKNKHPAENEPVAPNSAYPNAPTNMQQIETAKNHDIERWVSGTENADKIEDIGNEATHLNGLEGNDQLHARHEGLKKMHGGKGQDSYHIHGAAQDGKKLNIQTEITELEQHESIHIEDGVKNHKYEKGNLTERQVKDILMSNQIHIDNEANIQWDKFTYETGKANNQDELIMTYTGTNEPAEYRNYALKEAGNQKEVHDDVGNQKLRGNNQNNDFVVDNAGHKVVNGGLGTDHYEITLDRNGYKTGASMTVNKLEKGETITIVNRGAQTATHNKSITGEDALKLKQYLTSDTINVANHKDINWNNFTVTGGNIKGGTDIGKTDYTSTENYTSFTYHGTKKETSPPSK